MDALAPGLRLAPSLEETHTNGTPSPGAARKRESSVLTSTTPDAPAATQLRIFSSSEQLPRRR